jgi:hypothetical protein
LHSNSGFKNSPRRLLSEDRTRKRLAKPLTGGRRIDFTYEKLPQRQRRGSCKLRYFNLWLHILVNPRNYLYLTDFQDRVFSTKSGG